MKNELEILGFGQLIKGITRSWPGQPDSLVEQLLMNAQRCIISSSNQERAPSDHNLIGAILRTKDREVKGHDMLIRDKSGLNVERFRQKIAEIAWENYFECRNVDWLNNFLEEKLRDILESEATLRGFQARRKYQKWLTKEMKEMIRQRDEQKARARISGDPGEMNTYMRLRNKCSKELIKTKNKHLNDMFKNFEK